MKLDDICINLRLKAVENGLANLHARFAKPYNERLNEKEELSRWAKFEKEELSRWAKLAGVI